MESGEKVTTFKGHKNSIISMIVSPDGWIISASDEAIIVWNFNGVMLYTMSNFDLDPGRNKGLYLTADNKYLLSLQEHRLTY